MRTFGVLARVCLFLAVLVAVTVLISWGIGAAWLRSWVRGGWEMSGAAAFAVLVAAAACGLLRLGAVGRTRQRVGRPIAAVLVVGMAGLPWLSTLSLGTNVTLVLFGLGLVVDAPRRWRRALSTALILGAALSAFVVLSAYAFQATYTRVPNAVPTRGMSLPTAVSILLLAVVALTGDPAHAPCRLFCGAGPGGLLSRRLILPVLLLPPGLGLVAGALLRAGLSDVPAVLSALAALGSVIATGVILLTARQLEVVAAETRRAHEEEKKLRRQLEAIGRATIAVQDAAAMVPDADLRRVLLTICQEAQTITGAQYAALGIGTDPSRPFDPWVFTGVSEEQERAIGRHPRPVGLLGKVIHEAHPLRIPDIRREPAFLGLPPHHPEMTSFLGAPVRYRGRELGNLYLSNKQGAEEFTEDDERAVAMLADRAAVAMEVTRLRQLEARERSWLKQVIDQMPEGVLIADGSGRVVILNRAAQAFTVGDRGERDVFGNPVLFDVYLPSGAPEVINELPLVRALRGETVRGVELLLRTKDGTLVPILASASPLQEGEAPAGAVAVFQDISTIKALERMREEWTSVVAHDLRQPIQIIALAARMVERAHPGGMGAEESKFLARIQHSVQRLTRMIDDLLDVSRIEAHRLKIEREWMDLVSLAREAAERSEAPDRPVRVEVEGDVPWVVADSGRLEQVLGNLLSNAIKYGAPRTEVVVGLRARGDEVEVAVTNKGKALSDETIQRLFTRFHRGAWERKTGLGLGLYICKGLVEAHGGRIWAESTPEETTFHFTLPIEPRAKTAQEEWAPQAPG
ncbi:MAG: ATP-binding protein [Myxococcota bacterium]